MYVMLIQRSNPKYRRKYVYSIKSYNVFCDLVLVEAVKVVLLSNFALGKIVFGHKGFSELLQCYFTREIFVLLRTHTSGTGRFHCYHWQSVLLP